MYGTYLTYKITLHVVHIVNALYEEGDDDDDGDNNDNNNEQQHHHIGTHMGL